MNKNEALLNLSVTNPFPFDAIQPILDYFLKDSDLEKSVHRTQLVLTRAQELAISPYDIIGAIEWGKKNKAAWN